MNTVTFKDLLGKTFSKVKSNFDELTFQGEKSYKFYHDQDCCESVWIEDVVGELSDLEDSPITQAEETTEDGESEWGTMTWTFYRFATVKGSVTVRWCGESNGYYSESVDFMEVL